MSKRHPVLRPTTGQLTPPPSPRKRRRFLRESEETDGEMTIERYLYAADPYRASSVANPMPYPLRAVPSADQTPLQYRSEILDALNFHGFTAQPEIVLEDVTKPGYPQGDRPVTTLRIMYHTEQRTLGSFSSARDSLRRILIAHSHPHVHVEVVHIFLCFQPSLFPIEPKDSTVAFYEGVQSELFNLVNGHLGSSWRVFGLFRVGQTEEKALPSVTVLVRPTQVYDWASLERDMKRSIQRRFPDSLQLNVEFLPGALGETNPEGEHPGISQLSTITDEGKLGMGFSIGISGQRGGGTAGGFVTLTQGGVTRKGILTNYHVVSPLESSPAETRYKADSRGSSLFESDDAQSEIQYFAGKDIDATKNHVDQFIRETESLLQGLHERQQQNMMFKGEVSERLQTAISDRQRMLEEHKAKKLLFDKMPIILGKVRASSGKLLHENKIHDWAFVEFDDDTAAKLFGPNQMPTVPPNHEPSRYGIFLDLSLVPAETFGQLTEGDYYFKQGRTTGVTGGKCNGVLTYCNWSERDRVRYDQFGNPGTIMPGYTHEHVIFSKRIREAEHIQETFSAPGDSGSFLISSRGDVCGLLYGAITGLCGAPGSETTYVGAGLAMSMRDVMESVALRTMPRDASGNPSGPPGILGLP